MSCYQPLVGVVTGTNLDTGKRIVSISKHGSNPVPLPGQEVIKVPCGRCIGCQLDYSKQWADRCLLELEDCKDACFVTLTYDNDHIPTVVGRSSDSGGSFVHLTLCRRDVQLFLKRLRKMLSPCTIRFFGCGEYGSRTFRPHYHLILFGWYPPDAVPYGMSQTNNPMFTSKILDRAWSFPSRRNLLGEYDSPNKTSTSGGLVMVQRVNYATCAYTARYVTKKINSPRSSWYKDMGIEPPFSMMSRKPGIGRRYFDEHPELWDYDSIHVATEDGGKSIYAPRYFKKLLADQDPIKAENLAAMRKAQAIERNAFLEAESGLPIDEYLDRQEEILLGKIKSLKRSAV